AQLIALKEIRHGRHDFHTWVELAQIAGDPFDGRIISGRNDDGAGVRYGQRAHQSRIGDISIVHLVLPFLGVGETIETELESEVGNIRLLQNHAYDPADVTVPDDNDIMHRPAHRFER